jgi:hypothetical protein
VLPLLLRGLPLMCVSEGGELQCRSGTASGRSHGTALTLTCLRTISCSAHSAAMSYSAAGPGDPPGELPDAINPQLLFPPDYDIFTVEETLKLAYMHDPRLNGADIFALRRARGTQWSATSRQLSRHSALCERSV